MVRIIIDGRTDRGEFMSTGCFKFDLGNMYGRQITVPQLV